MEKQYKLEHTLGLIGSIIGIVVFIIALIVGLVLGAIGAVGAAYGGGGGGLIVLGVFAVIFSLASFIIGFIGTGKLNKNDKKGAILLIIGGGLGIICIFFAAFFSIKQRCYF